MPFEQSRRQSIFAEQSVISCGSLAVVFKNGTWDRRLSFLMCMAFSKLFASNVMWCRLFDVDVSRADRVFSNVLSGKGLSSPDLGKALNSV